MWARLNGTHRSVQHFLAGWAINQYQAHSLGRITSGHGPNYTNEKREVQIKIFGWRVLHGLIPCRGILANRHIDNSSSCPSCHEGCEDIKHVLFTCNRAKEIWRLLGVTNNIQNLLQVDRSGSVVVAEMIKASKQLDALNHVGLAELILTGGWYLWWERRKLVHGDIVQNPTRSTMAIATLTTNYQRAVKKRAKTKEGWKKPPQCNLLLNVDASYNQDRAPVVQAL